MLFAYTLLHVSISLLGIASGVVVIYGLLQNERLEGWTQFFLWTTVLTSVTGFGFPLTEKGLLPSHLFGVISLVLLAAAIYARGPKKLAGRWRVVYLVGAMASQYLNVFVLVVQMFLKTPALKALAPTQSEPPFAVAQLVILAVFLALGLKSLKTFRPEAASVG